MSDDYWWWADCTKLKTNRRKEKNMAIADYVKLNENKVNKKPKKRSYVEDFEESLSDIRKKGYCDEKTVNSFYLGVIARCLSGLCDMLSERESRKPGFVLTDDGFTAKRDPLLDYISCGTFSLDDYVKLKEKEVKKEMSDYMLELEEACNTLVDNCKNSRCATCLFGPIHCKLMITTPSEWPVDKIFEKEDSHE